MSFKSAIIILLIIISCICFYLGNLYQKKQNPTSQEWVEYTNSVHGYSVKYPKDWIINSENANNIEKYDDENCCNTASLSFTNGSVTWKLSINRLHTGGVAHDICEADGKNCSFTSVVTTVMNIPVKQIVTTNTNTNKILKVHFSTSDKKAGFGEINIDTDYISANNAKYFLEYEGQNIEAHLSTLDSITKSLHKTK